MFDRRYRKTFFFLEGLAFLILFQTFWTGFRLETLLPLASLIIGYKVEPVRRATWFLLVLFSFYLIFLNPTAIDGYILGLCGVYILFNTSIFRTRQFLFSVSILTLLFVVQVVAVIVTLDRNSGNLILPKVIVIDSILAILSVAFRAKFLGIVPREVELPPLRISGEDYSDREIAMLKLVWEGKTAKEIAIELKLSDGTIRKLLSRIYPKINVLGMKELYSLQYSHKIEWS